MIVKYPRGIPEINKATSQIQGILNADIEGLRDWLNTLDKGLRFDTFSLCGCIMHAYLLAVTGSSLRIYYESIEYRWKTCGRMEWKKLGDLDIPKWFTLFQVRAVNYNHVRSLSVGDALAIIDDMMNGRNEGNYEGNYDEWNEDY